MLRIIRTKYLQEVIILVMLLLAACYARTRLPVDEQHNSAKIQVHR